VGEQLKGEHREEGGDKQTDKCVLGPAAVVKGERIRNRKAVENGTGTSRQSCLFVLGDQAHSAVADGRGHSPERTRHIIVELGRNGGDARLRWGFRFRKIICRGAFVGNIVRFKLAPLEVRRWGLHAAHGFLFVNAMERLPGRWKENVRR
jgi:hypothetical protein